MVEREAEMAVAEKENVNEKVDEEIKAKEAEVFESPPVADSQPVIVVVDFELTQGEAYTVKSVDGKTIYRFEKGKSVSVTNTHDVAKFRMETKRFHEVGAPINHEAVNERKPLVYKKLGPAKRG